ncbi:terminase small subunit [Fructilactobacillus sanfranciscensis]|nr:terminase small subunit [Fructilactobacillus sanfranciscensis]
MTKVNTIKQSKHIWLVSHIKKLGGCLALLLQPSEVGKLESHWADNKSTARVHNTNKLINHDLNNIDATTEKQKLFCVYYIQPYNATQSYLRAYHYKRSTANVEGSRLINSLVNTKPAKRMT